LRKKKEKKATGMNEEAIDIISIFGRIFVTLRPNVFYKINWKKFPFGGCSISLFVL
jgi:hypothetical protein